MYLTKIFICLVEAFVPFVGVYALIWILIDIVSRSFRGKL